MTLSGLLNLFVAAVINVNSGGNLQTAIDSSSPGDTIVVEAGATFTGPFVLRTKANCGNGYIKIISSALGALPENTRVTAASASSMPQIRTSSGAVFTMETGSCYWWLDGLDVKTDSDTYMIFQGFPVDPHSGGDLSSQISQQPHHFVLNRIYFHTLYGANGNPNSCILWGGGSIRVSNSLMVCFSQDSESKGISSVNGPGPYELWNNQYQASGMGILLGGSGVSISGITPGSVHYKGEYSYRPPNWRKTSGTSNPSGACLIDANGAESYNNTMTAHWWRCQDDGMGGGTWTGGDQGAGTSPDFLGALKNCWEHKNTYGAWGEGLVCQFTWYPTFQQQHGALWLNNQVDNECGGCGNYNSGVFYTRIKNFKALRLPWGVSNAWGGIAAGNYTRISHDIGYENGVWVVGNYPEANSVGSFSIESIWVQTGGFLSGGQYVPQLRHDYVNHTVLLNTLNTASTPATTGSIVELDSNGPYSNSFNFVGNIPNWSGTGFRVTQGTPGSWNSIAGTINPPTMNMGFNVFVNDRTRDTIPGNCTGGKDPTLWTHAQYNNFGLDCVNPPRSCPTCIEVADFTALKFVNQATGDYHLDPTSPAVGIGPYGLDAGADIDVVNWATANTATGLPNPYLDMDVRSMVLGSTSIAWRYTSYSTGTCTWTLSTNKAFTGAAFTGTDSGGVRSRSISTTGLTADTRYFWRYICDGTYRRSGVVITNP